MIGKADIEERAREWSLRDDVVEKDYALGWVLWGIGATDGLGDRWAFVAPAVGRQRKPDAAGAHRAVLLPIARRD